MLNMTRDIFLNGLRMSECIGQRPYHSYGVHLGGVTLSYKYFIPIGILMNEHQMSLKRRK